jgi:hypothetical protein
MGAIASITHETFPKQGSSLGKRVEVFFHDDLDHHAADAMVRDDHEEPWRTIIALNDGRYVLTTECQYSPREW